jgi:pimeloyl-ACP methyl ester carboxylesterase
MPPTATPSSPVPLLLLNLPGGFGTRRMYPRLVARAKDAAAEGFASVTIELPGTGDRAPLPGADQARADLRAALAAGEKPSADVIDRLVLPLVDAAVPEWQTTLDAVLALPEIGDRVGFSGGVIAVGVRLAATDPRIAAAGLFAGSYVPRSTMTEAREIGIPIHVLLQWDDEGNDRQAALDLFDAFASTEKTLVANMGGHTGVPAFAGEDARRFFVRHLTS